MYFLVPIKMVQGQLPSPQLLQQHNLPIYSDIVEVGRDSLTVLTQSTGRAGMYMADQVPCDPDFGLVMIMTAELAVTADQFAACSLPSPS